MSLSTIMAGIKALSPTYDSDVEVNVRGYDEIVPTLREGECPMRMILAPDEKVGAELTADVSIGGVQRMTWTILDRLYMFPVNLDKGLENYNHKIYDYIASYGAAVSSKRCLDATDAVVTGVSFAGPYVMTFPRVEGSTPFWVVDAVLTVEEYI